MRFRVATRADIPAIVAVVNRAYRVEDAIVEGDRTDAGDAAQHLQRGRFVLAEEEGGLAGVVYVELAPPRGYFGMLAVEPAAQGHGLGAALVKEAEARASVAGCRYMEMSVINVRTGLASWYERLGYEPAGQAPFPVPERLKQPAHFALYRKRLAMREPVTAREENR